MLVVLWNYRALELITRSPYSGQYAPADYEGPSGSSQETLSLAEMETQSLLGRDFGLSLLSGPCAKFWTKLRMPWIPGGIFLLTNLALFVALLHQNQGLISEQQESW